jgi:hypothetical protein
MEKNICIIQAYMKWYFEGKVLLGDLGVDEGMIIIIKLK